MRWEVVLGYTASYQMGIKQDCNNAASSYSTFVTVL